MEEPVIIEVKEDPSETTTLIFCFLCLKELNHGEIGESDKFFSIQSLSRYLKISVAQEKKKVLGFLDKEDEGENDEVVSTCKECFDKAQMFSSLLQELELVKLRVNSSLQVIHGTIKKSQEDEDLMGRFGTRGLFGKEALCQLKFVENLRQEIIWKCDAKFKDEPAPAPVAISPTYAVVVGMEEESEDEDDSMISSPPVITIQNGTASLPSTLSISTSTSSATTTLTSTINCKFCNANYLEPIGLQKHVATTHCDQLFSSSKFPKVSNDQFKYIIERTIDSLMESCSTQNPSGKRAKMECHFCPFPQTYTARENFRNHLVKEHFDQVSKALVTYQENQMEEMKALFGSQDDDNDDVKDNDKGQKIKFLETGELNRIGKKVLACTVCWKRVVNIANHKCEGSRDPEKGLNSCDFCPMTFQTFIERELHIAELHCDEIFSDYNIRQVPKAEFNSLIEETFEQILGIKSNPSKKNRCPLCVNITLEKDKPRNWRRHMKSKHFDFVAQKIIERQMRSKGQDQVQAVNLNISDDVDDDDIKILEENGDYFELNESDVGRNTFTVKISSYKCNGCNATFTTEANLRNHVECCPKMMNDKANASSSNAIYKFKCDDCGTSFSHSASVHRHRKLYCPYRKNISSATSTTTSTIATFSSAPKVASKTPGSGVTNHFLCNQCGKRCLNKDRLLRHKKKFCPTRSTSTSSSASPSKSGKSTPSPNPVQSWKCDACGSSFTQSSSLYRHRRLYCAFRDGAPPPAPVESPRPVSVPVPLPRPPPPKVVRQTSPPPVSEKVAEGCWKCKACKKLFTQSSSLNRHKRDTCIYRNSKEQKKAQDQDLPFQCVGCGARFSTKIGLSLHNKRSSCFKKTSNSEQEPWNFEMDMDTSEEIPNSDSPSVDITVPAPPLVDIDVKNEMIVQNFEFVNENEEIVEDVGEEEEVQGEEHEEHEMFNLEQCEVVEVDEDTLISAIY